MTKGLLAGLGLFLMWTSVASAVVSMVDSGGLGTLSSAGVSVMIDKGKAQNSI